MPDFTVNADVDIELTILCSWCGEDLQVDVDDDTINVEPCEDCLDAAKEDAVAQAKKDWGV